jgi:hypothetical protein
MVGITDRGRRIVKCSAKKGLDRQDYGHHAIAIVTIACCTDAGVI